MSLPNDVVILSIEAVWRARERFVESLGEREACDFAALRFEKRRRDWLAGRIAAKRALQRRWGLPFSRLEVRAETDGPTSGRPCAWIEERRIGFLSISHSGDLAMATWSDQPVGIDAELVEPRDEGFATVAFTEEERRHLRAASNPDDAMTRMWCEKEAYAKYLGVGFRRSFSDLVVPAHLARETGRLVHRGQPMCWARVRDRRNT